MNEVYIVSTGAFLPGPARSNDEIELVLGEISPQLERYRAVVLRRNGIEQRHYAMTEAGDPTHSNVQLAEQAAVSCLKGSGRQFSEVDFLTFGTTVGDVMIPAFAQCVHGILGAQGMKPLAVHPTSGVCLSGIHGVQAAYWAIASGDAKLALCGGSERPSAVLKHHRYTEEYAKHQQLEAAYEGYSYFHADFLRYMLSDGAGSWLLSNKPADNGLSLKIDWIKTRSFAAELPTCMYMGTVRPDSVAPDDSWLAYPSAQQAEQDGALNIRQDVGLLSKHIARHGALFMRDLVDSGVLDEHAINWIFPHLSSFFFKDKTVEALKDVDIHFLMPNTGPT
ncbi:MAG TPA: hypothetical protein VFM46_09835 [Pseudomonadales bacterium]|nr:hypothetical protein [Pseudomonadales bacterium]